MPSRGSAKAENLFNPLGFSAWVSNEAPPWIFKSSGRRNAFEYGAKAAMGAHDHGRIYRRADCVRAEQEGREAGGRAVLHARQGYRPIIVCQCCDQPLARFAEAGDPG